MNADAILKELVNIRIARRAKFVPYDLDRRLKRKEKELWEMAEKFSALEQKSTPRRQPEKQSA